MEHVLAILKTIDIKSFGIGAGLMVALITGARALPGLIVNRVKARFRSAVLSGKIDAATARMITACAKAIFVWADEELPDQLGDDKMNMVMDKLAKVPFIGFVIRADPGAIRSLLQEEYDAINAEIKANASVEAPIPGQ